MPAPPEPPEGGGPTPEEAVPLSPPTEALAAEVGATDAILDPPPDPPDPPSEPPSGPPKEPPP